MTGGASSQRYGPWRGSLSTLLPAPSSLPPQAGLSDPGLALLDPVLWPPGRVGKGAREFRVVELHHHHRGPAGFPSPRGGKGPYPVTGAFSKTDSLAMER